MEETVQVPAIGLSVSETIGQRSIVLQTHIAGDCKPEELDAKLDQLLKAADRQKLYYETREELFKLKANLDHHEIQLQSMTDDIVRVDAEMKQRWDDAGRKGPYKPSPSERQQRGNIVKNIESFQFNIGRLKTAIAEAEATLAKIGKE